MDAADLAYSGIAAQAQLLRDREISSTELTDAYLTRIEAIDPALNSFREVFADQARAAAAEADTRIARGDDAPLLGVPVAFKDELDIEGRVAQHGTDAYDRPAEANAVHVQRLLDAGAIALGVTNLPELAVCGFTESTATGDTRNPWDTTRTPGGSSGGSGAAVAAGLVGAASASDGAGSIRIPAALNGLFGLKPQRGRISLMPEAEHWHGMSKTGCLTRRVIDTALWLDVAQGPAPGDAHTPPAPSGSYVDATRQPSVPLRIGRTERSVRGLLPPVKEPEALSGLDAASAVLTDLGHAVEPCDPAFGNAGNPMIALYLSGVHEHLESVPHPERLESRTRAGRACRPHRSDLRAGRCVDDPGDLDPARRGRSLARQGSAPHVAGHEPRLPLHRDLELHRPAGSGGAGRLQSRRSAAVGDARRTTEPRRPPAGACRPDGGSDRMAGSPSAGRGDVAPRTWVSRRVGLNLALDLRSRPSHAKGDPCRVDHSSESES
jgi:amidase